MNTHHNSTPIAGWSDPARAAKPTVLDRLRSVKSFFKPDPISTEGGGIKPEKPEKVDPLPPIRSPLEAFKDTITDGTRVFCERYVHPLYVDDKMTKFRVTGIKMYLPRNRNELMAVIEQLPIEVRNRLARLRAQNAPGAADQLVFDDEFFGISIDIEPTVIEGQYVSLIASWSGTSIEIKIAFTGQYVTVKQPVEIKPTTMIHEQAETPLKRQVAAGIAVNADTTRREQGGTAKFAVTAGATLPEAATRHGSCETLLSLPQHARQGKDTYIPALDHRPVARLRLLAHGAEKEIVLDICADMLPFVIGREYTASNRFKRGHNLVMNGDDPSVMMVSREHLELRSFDSDSFFQVVNHAINSNGSYHKGCLLPNYFPFKAAGQQNVIVLGGASGPGTVRVTFEGV